MDFAGLVDVDFAGEAKGEAEEEGDFPWGLLPPPPRCLFEPSLSFSSPFTPSADDDGFSTTVHRSLSLSLSLPLSPTAAFLCFSLSRSFSRSVPRTRSLSFSRSIARTRALSVARSRSRSLSLLRSSCFLRAASVIPRTRSFRIAIIYTMHNQLNQKLSKEEEPEDSTSSTFLVFSNNLLAFLRCARRSSRSLFCLSFLSFSIPVSSSLPFPSVPAPPSRPPETDVDKDVSGESDAPSFTNPTSPSSGTHLNRLNSSSTSKPPRSSHVLLDGLEARIVSSVVACYIHYAFITHY